MEDFSGFIGSDRIQPASEGHQLYKIHVFRLRAVFRRRIEPAVKGPLVEHRGLEGRDEVGHRVLRHHRHAGTGDERVNAVVHLGVDVIGPSGEYDDDNPQCVLTPEQIRLLRESHQSSSSYPAQFKDRKLWKPFLDAGFREWEDTRVLYCCIDRDV